MKNRLVRKGLVIGTIMLFVGAGVVPSISGDIGKISSLKNIATSQSELPTNRAWIYVPDDYPTIQEAINHAQSGDTVFVRSNIYYENVVVTKSINLIGEDKRRTFIDGNYELDVVHISHNMVYISGFTIQNGGQDEDDAGIDIKSNNNIIYNNTIRDNNNFGVYIWGSGNNQIYHNNFIKNALNAYDEGYNLWNSNEYGNFWSDYRERYPWAIPLIGKGIWSHPYEIPGPDDKTGGQSKDELASIRTLSMHKSKTMPRNNPFSYNFILLNWFFKQFPNAFPILRNLLEL